MTFLRSFSEAASKFFLEQERKKRKNLEVSLYIMRCSGLC